MKIICVDDEELVLGLTVSLCEELPLEPQVKGFKSANEALSYIGSNYADIAILDINMPGMDGLTLAAGIKEKSPNTIIIFLTGYGEYALEAYRLHASGYLMKPVSAERLKAEIDYALSGYKASEDDKDVRVQTFGEFDVFVNGSPVSFSRLKSKELLAYLVDRQGSFVSRKTVHAALWEEGMYDRSMQKQLDVIIRSLRDTLKKYGIEYIFELSGGQMRVIPEKFTCDIYRFFKGEIDAVNAYRGEYMSSYEWASLTEAYMDRLNNKFN